MLFRSGLPAWVESGATSAYPFSVKPHKPLSMDDLKRILDGRAAFYSKAEITLDTSGQTPEQSLQALSASVRKAMARAA